MLICSDPGQTNKKYFASLSLTHSPFSLSISLRVTLVAPLCVTVSCRVLCPGDTVVLRGTTLVSTPRYSMPQTSYLWFRGVFMSFSFSVSLTSYSIEVKARQDIHQTRTLHYYTAVATIAILKKCISSIFLLLATIRTVKSKSVI